MKNRPGFTILEVMIAAAIITLMLSALIVVGRTALGGSGVALRRSQATFWASEGIELVRQMRDTNWIDKSNATGWDSLVYDSSTGWGKADTATPSSYQLAFGTNRWYLQSSSIDKITLDGMEFTREVKVEDATVDSTINPGGVNAKKVTCTVRWNEDSTPKSIAISEILTNWRPNY